MKKARKLLTLTALSGLVAPNLLAQFNKLEAWGDAAGTTPPASFTSDGVTTTITGGGADFWGGSDQGVYVWNDTGALSSTGDFTATIRHVSTTNPAPEWGRDGILVRAVGASGAPAADDPNWLSFRKSNGVAEAGRRETRGGGTELSPLSVSDLAGINTGSVATTPFYLSAAREGNTMRAGGALSIGGAPGRWVEMGASVIPAFAAGNNVVIGLGHQSHPQTISPDTNDINTATFDQGTLSGTYNPAFFGPAAGPTTWNVGGSMSVNPNGGAITGSSYTQVGGVATGEATKWTIRAVDTNSFVPVYGVAGAAKNPTEMNTGDVVPAANFRINSTTPGLTANIYVNQANPGNIGAVRNIINNAANLSGTAIIPNVDWTGNGGTSPTNATQYNRGEGAADFSVAVPGQFAGANQENYGVHMVGEIFIPGDADRKGSIANAIKFKDGIDDFTFLAIDGQTILNDNDWTGYESRGAGQPGGGDQNGGSHVAAMDVSDPKFDDGEWVAFEMIAWEGGGGDAGVLYWDAGDVDGTFAGIALPSTPTNVLTMTGATQVGSESGTAAFPMNLPNGSWDVTLTVENTGTAATFNQQVTVVPEPTGIVLLTLTGLGAILRRRRR
jgi:hypothetical protein